MSYADSLTAQARTYQGPQAELVQLAPTVFKALANLLDAPQLTSSLRLQAAAAMGYFVAPFDAAPDAEGGEALLDDVFVGLHVLRAAREQAGDDVLDIAWPDQKYSAEKLAGWYERCGAALGASSRSALRFVGLDLAPDDV